jgi:LPS-assembly protein
MGSGTVDLDDIVYGQNASLWIADKVPLIPWIPFFAAAIRRERQSGFLFPEYGNSTTKGIFTRIPYFWAINDSQDMTIALDIFTKRGVGGEGEYRYVLSQQARGSFNGFFIRETLRDSSDRERLDIPENRGFFTFQHDWQLMPRLSLKMSANATTDDLVFREYGDRLQDRARQRAETNVFLSQRWDMWSLRPMCCGTRTSRRRSRRSCSAPEISCRLRQPVPGAPMLLYETEASFTNFIREVGDGGVRLDLHPRVFFPIPVAGLFTVTPFVGGRLTYYDRRAVGNRFTHTITVEDTVVEDRVRRQVEAGVEVEARASRVFQLDGRGGLAALQHVIEPRAILTEVRGLDQKALPQYDPGLRGTAGGIDTGFYGRAGVDNIGRVNEITYSLTNRLNAKTVSGPDQEPVRWEMARVGLSQTFDIGRALAQGQPFKDLTGNLIIQPAAFLRFQADAAYNMYGLGWRSANTDLTATYRDVAVTIGTRFNDIVGANFVTGQVDARLLPSLDGHVTVNYDVRDGSAVENRFGFDWRFQCFAISVEYVNRHKNENEFHLSINLLGVGQTGTKFGMGSP